MRNPFRRRTAETAADTPTHENENVTYFCVYCAVSEGEEHLEWCSRRGVMRAPDGGR